MSAGRIGSEELDGERGLLMGPAFSTPYQDRIRAARASQPRPNQAQPQSPQQPRDTESLEDKTEALKKFLFSGGFSNAPQPGATAMPANNFSPPQRPNPMVDSYPPASYQGMPAAQQNRSPERPNDIQAMENDLRRILKLNPGTQSGPNGGSLF
jgi:hypothetical protein